MGGLAAAAWDRELEDKVEEESGAQVVGRYKELHPRSASHLSCVIFFPLSSLSMEPTKRVMPAPHDWKQNYAGAIGES